MIVCMNPKRLKIAEVVDLPHVLVTMHMAKEVLGERHEGTEARRHEGRD